ncbi:MAG: GNAT family N-acetyltransferase [Acidobacteria bacterium]|nr:GNAT family N-acetyltransferase [Acidobacteriota bacterium]
MPELQRLRADHASAVLAFELANRAYFATHISDRGDEYFSNFDQEHSAQLAEHESGSCAYHVLVDEDGAIRGRFNLYEIHDGAANVGYRVAKDVAGRGVATAAVNELCQIAVEQYGVQRLRATVTHGNVASQKVLTRNGFIPDGPAEPGGRPGTWYLRTLGEECVDVGR